MSSQGTDITGEHTIGLQRLALEALVGLAAMYPQLPAPYVSLTVAGSLTLQLNSPQEFEAWRAALQVPTYGVALNQYQAYAWLSGTTVFRGVQLELSGHNLGLTEAQQTEPRDRQAVAA